jgi:hypothetical protein
MMSAEERRLREDLERLAASEQGRHLLQLSLRGIARGEREVTAGCWSERGIAGCLFQHAYWEGVREGIFADKGRPGDWIGSLAGPHEYGNVIRAIESFDRLARKEYADVEPRTLLPDRVRIRQPEWNSAVEALLVDALGRGQAELSTSRREVRVSA